MLRIVVIDKGSDLRFRVERFRQAQVRLAPPEFLDGTAVFRVSALEQFTTPLLD
jgi:hypothetical protein